MRIVHTADWHLCDRLGRVDRTDDLKRRVERVAELCIEHAADVLLIAGDLFSEQAGVEDMTKALNHLRDTFKPFFARGGTVLAITGNHDRDGKINFVRAGMTLAAPDLGPGTLLPGGRMYLVNGRAVATLTGAAGDRVQFVLVPFPFSSRYDLSATDYRSKEEENKLLHARVAEWVRQVPQQNVFEARLPTVLAAHVHVRGSNAHDLYKMTDRDDVLFEFADLNPMWSYIALGHIHKPQAIGGVASVRSSGSLDRPDFGETHDGHGVLLVDIDGPAAVVPRELPIPATPFYTIHLTDPEGELPGLAAKYPDRDRAIVRVRVTPTAAGPSRDEITRKIRSLFPRLHELQWVEICEEKADVPQFSPRNGFAATVRAFLEEGLAVDADKAAVMALAESFMAVEDQA